MEFFSADDVARLLPMTACIDLMENVLKDLAQGRAEMPLRSVMPFGERNLLGQMPAWWVSQSVVGTKIITIAPDNRNRRMPSHQGLVVLFAADDGVPLAVVDGERVTAIRTAAVSAVATRHLARSDVSRLGILGVGQQARTHLEAMLAVRSFERILVWGPHRDSARRFREDMAALSSVPIEVVDEPEDASAADVICTVTSSPTPVLLSDAVAYGAHINAVGACRADERELDSRLMARGDLYVDRRESAENESGDYVIPLQAGEIGRDHIVGELGELLLDRVPGRQSKQSVTIFKSLGLAVEDVAVAWALYQTRRGE